jgi:cytochrome c biogenesis protein ResB
MARRWSLLAAAAAVLVVVTPVLGVLDPGPVWLGLCAVVVAALGAALRRDRRESDDGGDVWELVPSWQYTGRHVESGGLARDEQEAALAEVEERAARREHDDP